MNHGEHIIPGFSLVAQHAVDVFNIMTGRGWYAMKDVRGRFFVKGKCQGEFSHLQTPHPVDEYGNPCRFDDPFTALVEAEKWYKVNVEDEK